MSAALTSAERETVLNMDDGSPVVTIWTCQRTTLTALRKKSHAFVETASGHYGATEWATFTIPADDFRLASAAKRKGTPRPHLRVAGSASVMASGGAA